MNVAGIDVGFRKTGITIFRLDHEPDELVFAATVGHDFKPSKQAGKVAADDVASVQNMLGCIENVLLSWEVLGTFIEIPSGGAQSARAARCMALATGLIASFMHQHQEMTHAFYQPREVEKKLGIYLGRNEAKELGFKKSGELTKYKKERMRNLVLAAFPDFTAWPKQKALAEDAYDSAAAFLCGRATNVHYRMLKQRATA